MAERLEYDPVCKQMSYVNPVCRLAKYIYFVRKLFI